MQSIPTLARGSGLVALALVLASSTALAEPAKKQKKAKTPPQEQGQTVDAPLPEVVVSADRPQRNAATTDGTGSYTSGAVTTAGKIPTKRIDVPNSVSVMTRQQIEDQNLTTVDQALARTPGVTMISNDSSQSQYYVRGYSPEAMVDGAPALSGFGGWQQFDTAIYDRLEVLKGPTGLLMGQGSPGGVVNFVKKTPKDVFGASLITSYGSWANKRAELDVTGPLGEEKRIRWRGVLAGTDRGYYFDRAHDTKWVGFGTVEIDLTDKTLLTVSAVHQDDHAPAFSGLPADKATGAFIDVPRSTNPYPSWSRNLWLTDEYAASLEHRFDNGWVAKASYTTRRQHFDFKDAYPWEGIDAAGNVEYVRRWWLYDYERNSADAFVRGPIELFGRTHEILLGTNYAFWGNEGVGQNFNGAIGSATPRVTGNIFNPDATVPEPAFVFNSGSRNEQKQIGIYGQGKIKIFDPLTLIVGSRVSWYDSRSRTIPPGAATGWSQGSKADGRLSPYAGLVYEIVKGINAYASYADIFVPTTSKKWDGGAGTILDPRTGAQYEVGLKGEFFGGKLQTSAAAFYIDDYNRTMSDLNHPGFYLPAGKAKSEGVELEVTGEALPGWQIATGYTYNHTKVLTAAPNTGNPITTWQPKHSFKLWTQYTVQDGRWAGVFGGLGLQAYSDSGNGNPPVRVQNPYTVVDLQAGYEINKHLKATFAVNNVFDTVYRTRIGGTNTYNTYGDPRNFLVTLKATF